MRAKGTGQSALLVLDVIDVLDRLRIPYAIIGAFAASYYGVVRTSLDVDAVISMPPTHSEMTTLREALCEAGLKSTVRRGDVGDPIGAVINVEDRFKNRVELLIGIRGVTDAAFARTVKASFMGETIRVIGLEDFIAIKLFAGSPKDLDDAVGALKVSRHRIRLPLLKELVQSYGKHVSRRLDSLLKEL